MKKLSISILVVFCLIGVLKSQVAINTDDSAPDNSAMLHVKSTTAGFLPPRMNTIQRESISSPAEGLCIFNTDSLCLEFWDGTAWFDICSGNSYTPVIAVEGDCSGVFWMDRNLGASQVATSSTDALSYGDLYQWGRAADGHEKRGSGITSTNATTAVPNGSNPWDGLAITEPDSPFDWLDPQDNTLWDGLSGTNNPCPTGYRLPTYTEWECERTKWSSNNAAGAYASPLKLPAAGCRYYSDGSLDDVGSFGYYWSSTVDGNYSQLLYCYSTIAYMDASYRASGLSVRCIKD